MYINNFRPFSVSQLALCIKYLSRKTLNTENVRQNCENFHLVVQSDALMFPSDLFSYS